MASSGGSRSSCCSRRSAWSRVYGRPVASSTAMTARQVSHGSVIVLMRPLRDDPRQDCGSSARSSRFGRDTPDQGIEETPMRADAGRKSVARRVRRLGVHNPLAPPQRRPTAGGCRTSRRSPRAIARLGILGLARGRPARGPGGFARRFRRTSFSCCIDESDIPITIPKGDRWVRKCARARGQGHRHRSTQAIVSIASSWAARFSYRVAMRRCCLRRINRRKTPYAVRVPPDHNKRIMGAGRKSVC